MSPPVNLLLYLLSLESTEPVVFLGKQFAVGMALGPDLLGREKCRAFGAGVSSSSLSWSAASRRSANSASRRHISGRGWRVWADL